MAIIEVLCLNTKDQSENSGTLVYEHPDIEKARAWVEAERMKRQSGLSDASDPDITVYWRIYDSLDDFRDGRARFATVVHSENDFPGMRALPVETTEDQL